jgi:signal transduction histidine kinase
VSILDYLATRRFKKAIAESLIAALLLAALTVVCLRLRLNLATVSLLFVIVIVLLARVGEFVSSIAAAVVAAVALAYLAPPDTSIRIDDPLDVVAVLAFLITAVTIATLVHRVRWFAEESLSSVNRKLIDAEERERSRIGKELHNDICQRIALLAIKCDLLGANLPDQRAEVLTRIDELQKETMELGASVQCLAHSLHSEKLEYLGLVTSARSFCRELEHEQKVEIDFEAHDFSNHVPPDVSLSLFRVMQEALTNSVKHSGARQFKVELLEKSDQIHLLVHDSGKGFDAKMVNGAGLGLISMRERIKLVKGELSVESQREQGTTIHASVPFAAKGTA